MALCAKCRKQIPPDAAHCVHCGAAVVKPAVAPKRTVLGFGPEAQGLRRRPSDAYKATMFSAEDQSQPAEVVPSPASPSPTSPAAPAAGSPDTYKPTLAPPSALPKGSAPPVTWGNQTPQSAPPAEASQEYMATMMAQPEQQPSANVPKDSSQDIPATMMAHPSQLPGGHSAPVPSAQQVPATIMAGSEQAAVPVALPGPRAPADTAARLVLASRSIAAEANPVEPGRGKLRWLLIGGGVLLLAAFCLPAVITAEGVSGFTWQQFSTLKGLALISQLYLAAGGALMILIGALPLPYVARGIMALTLSLIPLTLTSIGGTWRQGVSAFTLLVLCGGLLYRYRYRATKLSRILVAMGVVGVLLTLLVPLQGSVPLVAVFEQFGGSAGAAQIVTSAVMPLLLLVLSLLSLLAFLGPESSALANIWAICLMLFVPLKIWLPTIFALAAGGTSLAPIALGLASLVYLAVGAVGLAHFLTLFSHRNQAS